MDREIPPECTCGHYNFSHDSTSKCVWCSCLKFVPSLDKIRTSPEATRAAELAYGFKALIEPAKEDE
jgi:hypothetical protein